MPVPPELVSPNPELNLSLNEAGKVAHVLARWFVDALQYFVNPTTAGVPGGPVFLRNGQGLVDANVPEDGTISPVITPELQAMGVTADDPMYLLMTYKADTLPGQVNSTVEVARVKNLLGAGTVNDLINLYAYLLGSATAQGNALTALSRNPKIAAEIKADLTLPA